MICTAYQMFFQMIRSRIIRWAGHVAHMGERRGIYIVVNQEE